MKNFNFRPVVLFSAIAAATFMSACGSQNKLYSAPQGNPGFTNTGGLQTGGYVPSNSLALRCSPTANVVGNGMNATPDRNYRACNGTAIGAAQTQVAIFPEDGQSKQLCMFALQRGQYNQPTPVVVNPYAAPTARYAVQCGVIAAGGSLMNFDGVYLQGAFIVRYSEAAAFAQCLSTGNFQGCAAGYGIGFSAGFWL